MINNNFYKSVAPLGNNVSDLYKKYEHALLYIIGQIIIFNISEDKYYNKVKSRFEPNLNMSRDRRNKEPTFDELNKFAMHTKLINDTMIGKGVKYQMIVGNSLLKLFFDRYD